MHVSIISTLYLSEDFIEEFCARMQKSVESVTDSYEIILVDDGSPDKSYQRAQIIHESNNKIKLIQLSRNYGHHRAMYAGIQHSKGELIFLIDSDLQEQPEAFPDFYNLLSQQKDLDAAIGIQESRQASLLDRVSVLYYQLFNKLSDEAYQKESQMTIRLMRRNLVNAFLEYKDKEIYFAPLFSLAGFNQTFFPQKKLLKRKTTYTLAKRYNIFINAILSFSSKPLYFVFYSGILTTLAASFFVSYIVLAKLFSYPVASGWSSLMASIWFLGGIIITFIGLVAIYINKIYIEIKDRPLYSIKKLEGFSEE